MYPLPEVELGSEEPLYNIGVVARMTGVSMATLRAWERRYNFPEAGRTSGGHRLYSEKDVMRLRWVKARIDDGMGTSQAIHALQHQEQMGRMVHVPPSQEIQPQRQVQSVQIMRIEERLLSALEHRDLDKADSVLGEALAVWSPDDLILDVITPVMARLGDAWEEGQISVVTEHLGTNYLRQRLLMWMLNGPPPNPVKPVVLACAPEEWHEGSLLILGALLRRRRWPVAYLGQSVPLPDLANFVRDLQPKLVILVAMTEESVTNLVSWPDYFSQDTPQVCFGGRVFLTHPEWQTRIQGLYIGNTLRGGLERVEAILRQ